MEINERKGRSGGIIKKGILFLFPWRDSLAIMLQGTPFRFGELWAILVSLSFIKSGKYRISKREFWLILILGINLITAIIGITVYHTEINSSFAVKYIIRNVVYIAALLGFLLSDISFNEKDIDRLMKYTVWLLFIFFVSVNLTGYRLYMGKIVGWDWLSSTGQFFTILGHNIPRFMGTTAEAGFLSSMIIMPVYYYLNIFVYNRNDECSVGYKTSKKYLLLTIVMAIFSFSTAVYCFLIGVVFLTLYKSIKRVKSQRVILFTVVLVVIALITIVSIPDLRNLFIGQFINKVKVYVVNKNSYNWSAKDRSQHISNAINMFISSSPLQLIIGHGTGAYYAKSITMNASGELLMSADEAYNLYLSTLTDRGIIGLICVLMIAVISRKYITKSIYSRTIWVGIVGQYVHWGLSGNFWMYYFWFELFMLIGIYRYESKRSFINI